MATGWIDIKPRKLGQRWRLARLLQLTDSYKTWKILVDNAIRTDLVVAMDNWNIIGMARSNGWWN